MRGNDRYKWDAQDLMAALNLVSDFMTVVRGYGPPDRP
jgi:hypothetical protein